MLARFPEDRESTQLQDDQAWTQTPLHVVLILHAVTHVFH